MTKIRLGHFWLSNDGPLIRVNEHSATRCMCMIIMKEVMRDKKESGRALLDYAWSPCAPASSQGGSTG